MMDDIAEQQDVAKEISEAISSPVAFGQVSFFQGKKRIFNFFLQIRSSMRMNWRQSLTLSAKNWSWRNRRSLTSSSWTLDPLFLSLTSPGQFLPNPRLPRLRRKRRIPTWLSSLPGLLNERQQILCIAVIFACSDNFWYKGNQQYLRKCLNKLVL